MHDRRVVRGNTFAALVIPVSKLSVTPTKAADAHYLHIDMQPDMALIEKQRIDQIRRKQQLEQLRVTQHSIKPPYYRKGSMMK